MGILPEIFEVRDDGFLYVLDDHPRRRCAASSSRRSTAARRARSRSSKRSLAPVVGRTLTRPRVRFAPVADRVLPRRQRPDRAVQLAVRPPARRDVRAAHRGHRRGAQPRGVGRRDHRQALDGSGWSPTSRPSPVEFAAAHQRAVEAAVGRRRTSTAATAPARRSMRDSHDATTQTRLRRVLPGPRARARRRRRAAVPDARRGR